MSLGRMASQSFLLRITAALGTYVFVIVMARIMAADDFGVVATILSASLLFSAVGCLGQQTALLRFVPPLHEAEDKCAAHNLIHSSFHLALIGNVAIYIVILLGVAIGWLIGRVETPWALSFGLLLVPLTGWIEMQSYLARSYKSLNLALIPKDILWRLGSLAILVPIYFLIATNVTFLMTISVMIAVMLGLISAQWAIMRKSLKVPAHPFRKPLEDVRPPERWRTSIAPFTLSLASSQALSNLDVILVAMILGPSEAAIYYGANRFAQLVGFFEQSVAVVIGPNISRHFAAHKLDRVQDVVSTGVVLTSIPTLIIGCILFIMPEQLLGVMGQSFTDGAVALRILAVAGILSALFGPGAILLNMSDLEKHTMRAGLLSAIIAPPLMLLLGVLFDKEGVAAAAFIVFVLRKIYFHSVARILLGVKTDAISAIPIIRKMRNGKPQSNLTTELGDHDEN